MTLAAALVGRKARSGAIWFVLAYGISKLATFATNLVLARLLLPDDFGLFALVSLIIAAIAAINIVGVSAALIARQATDERTVNGAFWLNLTMGGVLSLLQIAVAPVIAYIYHQPLVVALLAVASLTTLIAPLGATHAALLARDLAFKRSVLPQVTLSVLNALFAIGLAFLGAGVWSFVLPALASNMVIVVLNWRLCPWRPAWRLDRDRWRGLLNFGGALILTQLLTFLNMNLDFMLIGAVLGVYALGFYSFAFNLAFLSISAVNYVVEGVVYPAFSRLRAEPEQLARTFFTVTRWISLGVFPFLLTQAALANDLIPVLFGEKWHASIPVFQCILIYSVFGALASLAGTILRTIERPDIDLKLTLIEALPVFGLILLGLRWGTLGVAVAVAISFSLTSSVMVMIALRMMRWPWQSLLAALAPALVATGLTIPLLVGLRWGLVLLDLPAALRLVLCAGAALVFYPLVLLVLFPAIVREARALAITLVGDFGRDMRRTVRPQTTTNG